jgi:hypothetical protein
MHYQALPYDTVGKEEPESELPHQSREYRRFSFNLAPANDFQILDFRWIPHYQVLPYDTEGKEEPDSGLNHAE